MIRAIIFDLDNCLLAPDAMGEDFLEPVFQAIGRANKNTVSETLLRTAFAELWISPLDSVSKKYNFSDAMKRAGWQAYEKLEVTVPIEGYPDLVVLTHLPVERYLVTSGFRKLQESKILALHLSDLFRAIMVDAIDAKVRKGKEKIFREIVEHTGFKPSEILVVGDDPDSEIEIGNRLGMRTVQILRPGVNYGLNATSHIHQLNELQSLLRSERSAANKQI